MSESPNATAVRAQVYVRGARAALTAKDDLAPIGSDLGSDLVSMAFHLYGCPGAHRGEFAASGDKTGSTLESVCLKNIAEGRKLNVNIHAFSCPTFMVR
jgi:hypothetical protein